MDPYKVLGVSPQSSAEDIKKAFREKAKRFHPDRNPGDRDAEIKFKEAGQAYALLSNPARRQQVPIPTDGRYRLDDVFDDLFGDSSSPFPDLEDEPERVRVLVQDQLLLAGGTIVVPYAGRRLRVQVPPRTEPGSRLRLRSQRSDGGDILLLLESSG